MAVFDDLFNRLGRIFGEIEDVWDFLNSIESSLFGTPGINSQFSEADRFQIDVLNGAYASFLIGMDAYLNALRTAAIQVFIEEVDGVEPLSSRSLNVALEALTRRMVADSLEVEESVVATGTPAYTGATGTGKLIPWIQKAEARANWPIVLQNLRAETITLTCISDAQDASVVSGEELFLVEGETAVDDLDRGFPKGSGARIEIASVHGKISETTGPGGNYLKNSGFDTFSVVNVPDGWNIVAGVPGTDIFENAGGMRPGKCIEFKGTASIHIRERFTADDQPTPDLTTRLGPRIIHCISVWMKDGATPPTAGQVTVVIEDNLGNDMGPSDLTIALSTLTATWAHFFVAFDSVKDILPQPQLSIQVTGMGAGQSFLMDELVLTELWVDPLRLQFPRFGIIAGPIDWLLSDRITVAPTRTGGKLLKFMDACFGLHASGLLIPENPAAGSDYDDVLVT